MRPGSILAILLALAPLSAFGQVDWTHRVIEGEDASSASFYLYQSNGDAVERVRWIWNGGAQNAPTVTDFILEADMILVRHSEGKREQIDELTNGKDVRLTTKTEYRLRADGSPLVLLPETGKKSLSEEHRTDLKNLIDLLARERSPWTP